MGFKKSGSFGLIFCHMLSMVMVDVVTCCLQVGLWLKSVQRSAAIWRCSAFIAWTGWTLAMTEMTYTVSGGALNSTQFNPALAITLLQSHDDSTINIILVLLVLLVLLLTCDIVKVFSTFCWWCIPQTDQFDVWKLHMKCFRMFPLLVGQLSDTGWALDEYLLHQCLCIFV